MRYVYPKLVHILSLVGFLLVRHDQFGQIAYQKFLVAQICIKKESRDIIILIRKLSRFWGKFSSTALVIYTFLCQILLCTNALLENWSQNRDNFLN